MKHIILLSTGLLVSASIVAQTPVTIATNAGNVDQVYYSLQNGVQSTAVLAEWDLAFEINSFNSSILVNTAKGLAAFETPVAIADWASLTVADEAAWTPLYNSLTSWSAGALTHGNDLSQPDGLNVGWGQYNMVTHVISGHRVYVIKLADQTYKKLRINALATSTYSFTYADLDGANEQTASLVKSNFAGKNFGYFNLATGTTLDLEPVATGWDLLFTKYTDDLGGGMWYGVAGVLQNKRVSVQQVDGVDPAMATWTANDLDSTINVIGYDWKTHQGNGVYEVATERTYFVQDRAGNIWKLIFTGYEAGAMTFTQELVSAVAVADAPGARDLVVYPNPVSTGRIDMIVGEEVRAGQLSIADRTGRLVKTQQMNGIGALSTIPVDLQGVEAGLYLVRLDAQGTLFTATLVVE